MTRLVRGADGRMWTIRARVEWMNPATGDDFEHDVHGGTGPVILMLGMLTLLAVILVAWTPSDVIVPAGLIFALALLLLFFPVRWAMRRPWTVVAETPGDAAELPPERWVGQVRGVFTIRTEAGKISRNIEVYSLPDLEGPLQPID